MALEPAVDRRLELEDALPLRHAGRAVPGLDPHTLHLRLHLAVPVRPHAAAGAVAHLLRAVHRARHAGLTQHALAAHPAVEEEALHVPLGGREGRIEAVVADAS